MSDGDRDSRRERRRFAAVSARVHKKTRRSARGDCATTYNIGAQLQNLPGHIARLCMRLHEYLFTNGQPQISRLGLEEEYLNKMAQIYERLLTNEVRRAARSRTRRRAANFRLLHFAKNIA